MTQNVYYVGVARTENGRGLVLGGHANHSDIDISGIKKVIEQPNLDITPGKHYSFTVGEVAWHLIQDEFFLYYVMICKQYYPQRVAHSCLDELQRQFTTRVGGNSAAEAKEKAYEKTCATMFQTICTKYNNLSEVDKLAAVNQKIDSVKVTMQENVSLALANCVKIESIESATEELQQQAGVFKKSAQDLKNKMWWKNVKLWIIIGVIVAIILIIIIAVAVSQSKAQQAAAKKTSGN